MKEELGTMNHKTKQLFNENQKLQLETNKIRSEMMNKCSEDRIDNQKSFVLYGLIENYWEPEEQSYD
jgi:regulator of replication initiation timing